MKIIKEPLVHFLLLAVLLFVLEAVFSSTQKEQIIVDRQTADYLIKQQEDLVLRTLSAKERKDIIDSYVEDEILYSEAYKRGLDKGDTRMRRNMILKMRGLLSGDIRKPADAEIRAYFENNREEFTRPATVSLDHVYYSDTSKIPQDLLEQLQAGADHRNFGESTFMLGPSIPGASQQVLVGFFGSEATRSIVAIEHDQWHGPFETARGIHFVRITDRSPESQLSFEEVKSYIEGQWMLSEARRLIEQEIVHLRDSYEVVIEAEGVSAE
jgi:hypothetical protein